jgi:hypothetical protein
MEQHNSRMIRQSLIQTWQELRMARLTRLCRLPVALRCRRRKCTEEETREEQKEYEMALQQRPEDL